MLKILLISPWLPWPPFDGARIRILETLRYLASRHEVTLLASIQSSDEAHNVESIASLCKHVEVEYLPDSTNRRLRRLGRGLLKGSSFIESFYFNEALADRVAAITAGNDFDIVQVELSFLGRYAGAISPRCKARRVLATHNVETQRFRRELRLRTRGTRRLVLRGDDLFFPNWELKAMKRFDGIVAVSEPDLAWIQKNVPERPVQLVPNGVDVNYFRPERTESSGPPAIVFTGLMNYPPNVDAVCWFVEEIFPAVRERHPELRFQIVGARPTERVEALAHHPGVEVTGEVPDIRPYVAKAKAFVVPLRSGGGTRLKILQAMSMACPVISTAMGAEGLQMNDGETILFAEDAGQFADRIDRVLAAPEEGGRIGRTGRDLAEARYDWKKCLAGLDALYDRLLRTGAP